MGTQRRGHVTVTPGLDAVILPSVRSRNGTGLKSPGSDTAAEGLFVPSESLRDQLVAIRRRLWIVNATLESLPSKIEQTYRQRSAIAVGDESDQRRKNSDTILDEAAALERHQAAAGWWARWKLARLRTRALRAEARAAAALHDASVSFGAALEAVLQAAVARVKADEAGFQSLPLPSRRKLAPVNDQACGLRKHPRTTRCDQVDYVGLSRRRESAIPLRPSSALSRRWHGLGLLTEAAQ